MCIAVPGRVLEIVDPQLRVGRVELSGAPRLVNLGALPDVRPGDWVLVHAGFAVERMSEEEAAETLRFIDEMSRAFVEEASARGSP